MSEGRVLGGVAKARNKFCCIFHLLIFLCFIVLFFNGAQRGLSHTKIGFCPNIYFYLRQLVSHSVSLVAWWARYEAKAMMAWAHEALARATAEDTKAKAAQAEINAHTGQHQYAGKILGGPPSGKSPPTTKAAATGPQLQKDQLNGGCNKYRGVVHQATSNQLASLTRLKEAKEE